MLLLIRKGELGNNLKTLPITIKMDVYRKVLKFFSDYRNINAYRKVIKTKLAKEETPTTLL